MKGKIEKYEPYRKGSWLYRLEYMITYKPKDYTGESMAVRAEDMAEFMEDINKRWKEIEKRKGKEVK